VRWRYRRFDSFGFVKIESQLESHILEIAPFHDIDGAIEPGSLAEESILFASPAEVLEIVSANPSLTCGTDTPAGLDWPIAGEAPDIHAEAATGAVVPILGDCERAARATRKHRARRYLDRRFELAVRNELARPYVENRGFILGNPVGTGVCGAIAPFDNLVPVDPLHSAEIGDNAG
jgi:hypothetical protein